VSNRNQHAIDEYFSGSRQAVDSTLRHCGYYIDGAVELIRTACVARHHIYIIGNGGSAAMAQHFAAELVGYFSKGNKPLSAFALSTDTSFLTAWSNDVDFADVFARQLEAHGCAGDVLIAISTSGASANVLRGLEVARRIGMRRIALLGRGASKADVLADMTIHVDSSETPHIQEGHLIVLHAICHCLADLR